MPPPPKSPATRPAPKPKQPLPRPKNPPENSPKTAARNRENTQRLRKLTLPSNPKTTTARILTAKTNTPKSPRRKKKNLQPHQPKNTRASRHASPPKPSQKRNPANFLTSDL